MKPKDTNIPVISLQYQLRPSIENHCMVFFSEDENWIFLIQQAWDEGRDFGGVRWCYYWACETHKISDWILNLRRSCVSSSGLGRGASVEEFEIACLWLLFECQGISYFACWNLFVPSLRALNSACLAKACTICCFEVSSPSMSKFVGEMMLNMGSLPIA